MKRITVREFRANIARQTAPVQVGEAGVWYPKGSLDTAAELETLSIAILEGKTPPQAPLARVGDRFNSRPFTPVPKKGK